MINEEKYPLDLNLRALQRYVACGSANPLLGHTSACMQAQGDCDQGCAESADSRPASELPSEARARWAAPPAHKHSAHEDRVQPVTRFRAKRINEVLVRDQRALLAEVQQNDADDQAGDQ